MQPYLWAPSLKSLAQDKRPPQADRTKHKRKDYGIIMETKISFDQKLHDLSEPVFSPLKYGQSATPTPEGLSKEDIIG